MRPRMVPTFGADINDSRASFSEAEPAHMEAGDLVRAEDAFRRVIVLENPRR